MIVPSMSMSEMIQNAMSDLDCVKKKFLLYDKELKRERIKKRVQGISRVFEYQSPKKNKWIMAITSSKRFIIGCFAVYYIDEHGLNAFFILHNDNELSVSHIPAHFLKRYNERFYKNLGAGKLEVLKEFVRRNPNSMKKHSSIPESNENGKPIFIVFNDGIGLGFEEKIGQITLNRYKTFIPTELMFPNQKKDFDTGFLIAKIRHGDLLDKYY